MDGIDERVRRLAVEVCEQPTSAPEDWTPDGPLAGYGFDSLALVHLVMRVEQEFELDLQPEDMTGAAFSSLAAIGELVRSRLA
ncbi:MAG TPA: acyl carrier protein [Jatrophihabitans sp.]|nr:acyl carrier protein [Jatrophihabitans sp.]